MKIVIDNDMVCRCKKLTTALDRFFKKYPNLTYWKETFESMAENHQDFLKDGNDDLWGWALHLDIDENYYYIAVIERE